MPNQIDYAFIAAREGGIKLDGYVPAAQLSKSGVTIATGFDLGQRSKQDLIQLSLPQRLIDQLSPYLGQKRQDAKKLLDEKPLRITLGEALLINRAVKYKELKELVASYGASPHNVSKAAFFGLPAEAQTAIASVNFQYGDLPSATPGFWKLVCKQDWRGATAELRNFGDRYESRRNLEADLLEKLVRTPVAEMAR